MSQASHSYEAAFSLAELMLCIMLSLVIATISVPSLRSAIDRAALTAAVASTEQLVAEAIARATHLGSATALQLYDTDNGLQWRFVETPRAGGIGSKIRTVPLGGRVVVQTADFAATPAVVSQSDAVRATVTYYPSGAASPGTLLLSAGDRRCRIVQPLRGAAHVEWIE